MKKTLSLALALVLALALAAPACAETQPTEPQFIAAGDGEVYDRILRALLFQPADRQAVLTFHSNIQLTGNPVILGTSDYGGQFGGEAYTVPPRDVVIDLNGYTLTGEADCPLFVVQSGYTLTIRDSSREQTGTLFTRGSEIVTVEEGGTYNAFQKVSANGAVYPHILLTMMNQPEGETARLRLDTDIQLVHSAVVVGSSDYDGLFGGEVQVVPPHDVVIDLNGHTLRGEAGCPLFVVQNGYTLTIVDSSEGKTGKLVTQGEDCVVVEGGGKYIPLDGGSQQPEDPPAIIVEEIPASGTSYAVDQNITVDGKAVAFQTYALKDENGNGTNYVKLRDIAYVLSGTASQFDVGYDAVHISITVTTSQAYTVAGGEMSTPFAGADRTYAGGAISLTINGKPVQLTAISLLDDSGNGYTYFKLRDLGAALGFHVGFSSERGVYIETGRPYAG